jgi:hypothetical protein
VERLKRLQRVLEVYVLSKGFMDLPPGTLRELMAYVCMAGFSGWLHVDSIHISLKLTPFTFCHSAALTFYEEHDAACCPLFEMDVVPFSAAASQVRAKASTLKCICGLVGVSNVPYHTFLPCH